MEELAVERSYCGGLVVQYVEDRVELRNLQQVVNLLGQVQEFQLSALVANRSKCTDQFADTRAVNVVDIAQMGVFTSRHRTQ